MTCRQLSEFVSDYLENRLPAEERARFEEHIRDCPECQVYLRTFKATMRLSKGSVDHPDDPVAADMPEELVRAILTTRRRGH